MFFYPHDTSISNHFSQIFERLILDKITIIKNTVSNQFGFKSKTSCNHAIFVLIETIEYYRSKFTPIHLVFLDASKAFDRVWQL